MFEHWQLRRYNVRNLFRQFREKERLNRVRLIKRRRSIVIFLSKHHDGESFLKPLLVGIECLNEEFQALTTKIVLLTLYGKTMREELGNYAAPDGQEAAEK